MKKRTVYLALAALLVITAVLAAAHLTSREEVPAGAVSVQWSGGKALVSLGEMELFPVQGTVVNGRGEEKTVDASGVLLSAVLERAGAGGYETVAVTAADEYSARLSADEIGEPDRVYLTVEQDGSLRLVVFGDADSKRQVSGVERLTLS